MVREKFTVVEEGTVPLDTGPGEQSYLVFKAPTGVLKLEFTTKPRKIGEKSHRAKRIGADAMVETIYSDTETVGFLKAYRQVDGGWDEMEPPETFQ